MDGISGKATVAAIRAFQRLHGLRADGIPGPLTKAELFPAPMQERDAPAPATPPLQDEVIRWPR